MTSASVMPSAAACSGICLSTSGVRTKPGPRQDAYESTVSYLGIEVDDALEIAEQTEI
jgi:hypothetical protein